MLAEIVWIEINQRIFSNPSLHIAIIDGGLVGVIEIASGRKVKIKYTMCCPSQKILQSILL